MRLEIIAPERCLFTGDVTMIKVPGTNGEFQILKNHAPIVSTLDKGVITIRNTDNSEQIFEIESGLLKCNKNEVNILVEQ